jgi:hypothetical protein
MRRDKGRKVAMYAVAFGLGLILSIFCPPGLMMFIIAVIIIALGIALFRC